MYRSRLLLVTVLSIFTLIVHFVALICLFSVYAKLLFSRPSSKNDTEKFAKFHIVGESVTVLSFSLLTIILGLSVVISILMRLFETRLIVFKSILSVSVFSLIGAIWPRLLALIENWNCPDSLPFVGNICWLFIAGSTTVLLMSIVELTIGFTCRNESVKLKNRVKMRRKKQRVGSTHPEISSPRMGSIADGNMTRITDQGVVPVPISSVYELVDYDRSTLPDISMDSTVCTTLEKSRTSMMTNELDDYQFYDGPLQAGNSLFQHDRQERSIL